LLDFEIMGYTTNKLSRLELDTLFEKNIITKEVLNNVMKESKFKNAIHPFYNGDLDLNDFFDTLIELNELSYFFKYYTNLDGYNVSNEISVKKEDNSIAPRAIMNPADLMIALESIACNIEPNQLDGIRDLTEKETMYLDLLKKLPYIISYLYTSISEQYISSKSWSI